VTDEDGHERNHADPAFGVHGGLLHDGGKSVPRPSIDAAGHALCQSRRVRSAL
jgi:hypothetical protein